jgi:hypothetical protein
MLGGKVLEGQYGNLFGDSRTCIALCHFPDSLKRQTFGPLLLSPVTHPLHDQLLQVGGFDVGGNVPLDLGRPIGTVRLFQFEAPVALFALYSAGGVAFLPAPLVSNVSGGGTFSWIRWI